MVNKGFLIIALVAMVALITMPVSAYTEKGSLTFGEESAPAGQVDVHHVCFKSWEEFESTTLITVEMTGAQCGNAKPNTWSGAVQIRTAEGDGAGILLGNGTVDVDYSAAACNWAQRAGTIEYAITDLDVGSRTGEGCVWFYGTGLQLAYYNYGRVNGYEPTDNWEVFPSNSISEAAYPIAHSEIHIYGGTSVVTPEASFSCTPTSQLPDADVVCTDSSTNTPTDWLWTIDAEAIGYEGWQTHTGQNFTWQSHYPGLYSVNLRVNNSAGFSWENKTNYVSIAENATPNSCDLEPASGYVRTYAQTNDGMTSGGIYDSAIQMKDVEAGAWSNVSNSGGWWCIDTLPGHSLNLYAQASGYTDVSQIGVAANGGRYYLVMWPDYIPAASAGNVTLYALVYDQQTGAPLYMSSVRVDGNSINTIVKNTGPEGQAMFTVKNDTAIHVTASKTGYTSITKVLTTSHFGPDTVMISLPRTSTTPTATPTATPSWMTPSTTVDPRTSTQKDQDMMNLIRDNGSALIGLAIITTMLGLMKMWGK